MNLRNATLEDHSWRTGGGSTTLGTAIGAVTIKKAIDYWPDTGTQRTVVFTSDGKLQKDDGSGGAWVVLASGLTVSGTVPFFAIGGQESAGRLRRCFYADGVNAPQVLSGDGIATTAVTAPPADWAGTNQPLWFAPHQGFMWAGGNKNAPHTIYRSKLIDYMDWTAVPYSLPIAPGESERVVGAVSYKGGLLVWKYPEGVYFVDTSAATDTSWRVIKVAGPGGVGAGAIASVEDDVFWVSPDGSWHMISATLATGSVRASDLTYRKLGSFFRTAIELSGLSTSELVYYSTKQELALACAATGSTSKNRRMVMDLNRRQDLGERWIFWDRDVNEALFARKVNNVLVPHFGDTAGQLWALDQTNRRAGSPAAGYTFEFFTQDTDFGQAVPAFQGRKKNLRFVQVEFDPRGTATLTLELYRDGSLSQTLQILLTGGGATLPSTLTFTLGASTMMLSPRRRARGQFTRLAIRGTCAVLDADVSITKVLLGVELAEEAPQMAA